MGLGILVKKMLQNEDNKIRHVIDKLSSINPPSVGSRITSWWRGLTNSFTSKKGLQINMVVDEPAELVSPLQLTMDDRQPTRQESFIEPISSSCDCNCDAAVQSQEQELTAVEPVAAVEPEPAVEPDAACEGQEEEPATLTDDKKGI
jgi:hypothetical protein